MRLRFLVIALLTAFPAFAVAGFAAEPRVSRDVPYAQPGDERQTLDVYSPAEGTGHPVVVWIHGGGWRRGDKRNVQHKPQAFVDQGYVFVSVNYRFVPQVTVKEMAGDVAKAIAWVVGHAGDYGGDGRKIFVMGHSAGAHLAALVCTDARYLKNEGITLSLLKGCVPVDTAAYDISARFRSAGPLQAKAGASVFGDDAAAHRELSPITYVEKGRAIPPFLILHVADRPDSRAQSEALAKALVATGRKATLVPAAGKTHGTINSELGLPDDKPTKAVFEFLAEQSP